MGDCSFCGQSAGFLRGKHNECKAKHHHGWTKIVSLTANAITEEFSVETPEPRVEFTRFRSRDLRELGEEGILRYIQTTSRGLGEGSNNGP